MSTTRVLGRISAGVGIAVAVASQPTLLTSIAIGVTVLLVGVVLPAVWSRKKHRREAAGNVLQQLLGALRPQTDKG